MVAVREVSVDEAVAHKRRFIERMERRYERSSEAMAAAVKEGRFPETAEIGQWLSTYRMLKSLQQKLAGQRMTGTPTTST